MTSEVVHLYSIPLLWEKSIFDLNKKENNFVSKIFYDKLKGSNGVKISKQKNILDNKSLKRLKNFFNERADVYVQKVLQINQKVFMTNSWLANSNKNSSHHTHNHKGAFLSLVYYVQCNSGKLIINEDRSAIQKGYDFDYEVIKHNSFNTPRFTFEVKTGDLVIFPGHLSHCTEKNSDEKDRIIIGANYFLKGPIGTNNNISSVNI